MNSKYTVDEGERDEKQSSREGKESISAHPQGPDRSFGLNRGRIEAGGKRYA
jgi:hypothetical protein